MTMNDIKRTTCCEERLFFTADRYRLIYIKDKQAYKAIGDDTHDIVYWFREIEVEAAEVIRLLPANGRLQVYLNLVVPVEDCSKRWLIRCHL